MLRICREHIEHIFGTYLKYADHIQYIHGATEPIGVNDGRKRKEEIPRAA